jgi:hypothetical protein
LDRNLDEAETGVPGAVGECDLRDDLPVEGGTLE